MTEPMAPETLQARFSEAPNAAFRLRTMLGPDMALTIASHAPALDAPVVGGQSAHLAMAGADVSVGIARRLANGATLSIVSQSSDSYRANGFGRTASSATALQYQDEIGPVTVALAYGTVREEDAALGLVWDRGWGERADGRTEFAGLSLGWSPIDALELGANVELGRARFEGSGWLTLEAPLITTAASLAARYHATPDIFAQHDLHGALILTISQPLRVEEGAFRALLPMSDNYGRAHMTFEERLLSATPSGREIETRLGYWLWSEDAFSARAEIAHRSEPGHVRDAGDALEALVGFRLRY